ncbi:Oidioi.mRNA.OKI2018_I69.PAR.g9347.t1.cds [Oikopleura dioica]|nr:Oidioi.mRNA.OKI2018_I69.PAR.g9347.t1.cds [Oikopleura dioica]
MSSVLFPIDDFNTRISLIRYGSSAFISHRLNEEQSYSKIKENLFRLEHTFEDQTNVHFGLRKAMTEFSSCPRDEKNQNSKKAIVIITDGEFTEPKLAVEELKIAKSIGVEIFILAVGDFDLNLSHHEIERTIDYIIHVDDFEELLEKIFFVKKAQFECFDYFEEDNFDDDDNELEEVHFRDACFGENPCDQLCFNQKNSDLPKCACEFGYLSVGNSCVLDSSFNQSQISTSRLTEIRKNLTNGTIDIFQKVASALKKHKEDLLFTWIVGCILGLTFVAGIVLFKMYKNRSRGGRYFEYS